MRGAHGGIVVVAPMGTNPLLGGSFSTVPAGTRSGFLILFNSTRAGALRLNFWAILNNDSPGCTVYSRTDTMLVDVVDDEVELTGTVESEVEPPSVSSDDNTARNANEHVAHRR